MDSTEVRSVITKYRIKERLRKLSALPIAIKIIAGLAIMNTLLAWFYAHFEFALPTSALFAYYGFRAYERMQKWWDEGAIEHKLYFAAMPATVSNNEDGTRTIRTRWSYTNRANCDLFVMIDMEDVSIDGLVPKKPWSKSPVFILPTGGSMLLIAEPINGVLPSSDGSLVKLSLRYGKAKKKMTVRWFSEANVKFPDANIGRTGMEMDMFRNDYEQIFESDVDN